MEGSRARRTARGGAAVVLILAGAGAALARHRPASVPASPPPVLREDALARARREVSLSDAEASVRLLRGLEAHLAERRDGP